MTSEEKIAELLGPAAAHHRSIGTRYHHYPSRALVVAWEVRDGCVGHVALGVDPWQEPRLGAAQLLAELLVIYGLLDASRWAEPRDGSARVRYQRVAALTQALGLGTVAGLARGEFLEGDLSPGRARVLAEIAAQGPRGERPPWSRTARVLFDKLLRYRHDVHGVIHGSSGWLECSEPALLGMLATQDRIGARLREMMSDIDRWLGSLMDPDGRTFELRELIAQHGWPDVDLYLLERSEEED